MTYECVENDVSNMLDSEEKYRIIFENSAVAIMLTDENERVVSWNSYTERLLGFGHDDLFMKPVESLYPSEEWQKIRSMNIRDKGMQHHLETKIFRKGSEPLDVDISLSVLKNNLGNITGSIGVIKDISDRKKAEQRLTSIMDHADDSIYVVDHEGRYLTANNELFRRLNLPREQVIGKKFCELHGTEETDIFFKNITKIFDTGEFVREEHKVSRLGQWFLRTYSPIKDTITGKVTSVVIISKDITYWKKTEKELQSSEKRYRTVFENSAVAFMLTDENERVVSWNSYTERLLGFGHDDLFMKPVESLYPSEEWQKIRSMNIRDKGMQHHLETKMLRKGSEPLDVDISLSVLKDDEGKITGSIGVIKDISERINAESKVRFEHSLLQSLLDNVPDSIYFKNKENRFILVNKAKADHSNTTIDGMIGKTDYDYMSSEQAKKSFDDDNKVMQTGKPIANDVEKITRDHGEERWVSVTKVPRYNDRNEIIGTMGISRDITKFIKEKKETEKYKQVAVGRNLRMVELRDKVKDILNELDKE